MKPTSLLLALMAFDLSAQTLPPKDVPRRPLPYESLNSVPSGVVVAEDREKIQEFVDTKMQLLQRIIDNSQANCPDLLSDRISVRDFLEMVQVEDDAARLEIAGAYDEMFSRLSVQGQDDLGLSLNENRGTIQSSTFVYTYERRPDLVGPYVRWRCENGFPEPGSVPPESLGIAVGHAPTDQPDRSSRP